MPTICKIDKEGYLYFKRGDKFRVQYCIGPYQKYGVYCCDECPYFHTHPESLSHYARIHLCNDIRHRMDKIVDERINGNNNDSTNESIIDDLNNINIKIEGREN